MGATLFVEAADVVGESAVYDDQRGALLWVDIAGKRNSSPVLLGGESVTEIRLRQTFRPPSGCALSVARLRRRDRVVLSGIMAGTSVRLHSSSLTCLTTALTRAASALTAPSGLARCRIISTSDGSPKAMSRSSGAPIALTMTAM